jgi:hypothetical protein
MTKAVLAIAALAFIPGLSIAGFIVIGILAVHHH